ncbi:MAG: polymorphic toxin type 23 domain-containing protein [Flavobacteriales bacterium]
MFKFKAYGMSLLLTIVTTIAFSQSVITLDQPEFGNQTHRATEKIYLQSGYSYVPSGSDKMRAYISSIFNFSVDASTVGQDFTTYYISGMGVGGDFFMQTTDTFELSALDTNKLVTINFADTNQVNAVAISITFNENNQIETAFALITDESDSYEYSIIPYLSLEGDNIIFDLSELVTNHVSKCFQYNDYHWVSNKSYDENGVVVDEGITYTDNIGRSIQSQVRNFSTNKIMAKENIYDSFGRLAISTLSAPIYSGAFCYKPTFITANSGDPYDASKFDLPNTSSALSGEIDNPYAVDATTKGTLGWYFSNDNDEEPYVATSGFPYSRVEYYSDPLGRPKRMAGISENYKMGSGHETKIFYGEAGFELSYVYNNNNNSLNKISKTISVNADGLEKIEYTDGLGNVRATCYSGIDDGCMDLPIKHELPYYSQRSIDVHVPNITGQELKWYWNTSKNCGQLNFVEIKLIDLVTEKELIENVDYVLDVNQVFDFSGGSYANKTLYLRIQYNYTSAYIGQNGAYYSGWYNSAQHQPQSGNNFPSQSFGYILDYSHWALHYYDENGNITKIIPPEGVDCNGANPSIGYASETHWEDYDVYNSSSYPYNPAYAFTYYNYNENNSAIFTDQTLQTHKIELELQTRQYIPNYSSGDPCDDGLTGTFDDAQIDGNRTLTEYISSTFSKYSENSGDYNKHRMAGSDELEDSLRLVAKFIKLSNDSIDLENRIAENLLQQQVLGDKITYIDSLINYGAFCLNFDGTNDYVELFSPIVDNIGDGDFTFEAKIKGDEASIGSNPTIFCSRPDTLSGMKFFFHNISGGSSYKMLAVRLEGSDYFIENNGTLDASLLDNSCHHVAITKHNDTLYFYADGVLFGTKAISGSNLDISTESNLRIGSDETNSTPFEGVISEVRLWNTVLHDTTIVQNLNNIVSSLSSNLLVNIDMNEGADDYMVNEVSNEIVQRGSTDTTDNNDPQWSNTSCCNDSVAMVKLEYEKIMLEAALDKLKNEDTTLNELLVFIDTVKATIENEGYYPIEPNNYIEYMFVRDGEILSDSTNNMRVSSGTIIIDPDPDPDPNPPLDPCYNKPPRLIAKFHFQLELLVYDGSTVGYVQPNGSVSSTPYSYSIYPELYKTCECEYYWNQLSLTSIGTIVINDQELNDYDDGVRFNIKNITVAKNNGYFLPFDVNDGVHKFARYLHFFTYMTHSTAPKVTDEISHSMETTYEYDVLNQLVKTTTPDAGITENVYDIQGNVRFSQDAQQEIDEKFSYVNYDRAGRPIESGVYDYSNSAALQFQNQDGLPALNPGETSVLTVIDEIDGLNDTYCSEQTFTLYDLPDENTSPYYPFNTAPYTNYKQKHLLGRVSKIWNENSIMWYSYDMYGRVVWTIEYIIDAAIADYKTIDYEYDAAGNITKTIYQKYETEYFEHRYAYDNGQQLIKVETSTDGAAYDQQANYSYYQHGGLKRTEVGNKLQGIDYLYTIDGKLKAINSPNLGESGIGIFSDPGLDGEGTSLFYTDIFGMTIDYHTADYIRAETFVNYGLGTNEKYSGTINQIRWNTDEPTLGLDLTSSGKQNTYQYSYNDFNWITGATFGEYTPTCQQNNNNILNCRIPPSFTADVNNQFKISGITYDKNGNIETFVRNGNSTTGISMDNLDYKYATITQPDNDVVKTNNRLTYVTDAVSTTAYTTDIENQSAANYTYNAIGEGIASVGDDETYTYYQNGLPKEIKATSTGNLKLKFEYNASGQRLKKTIYDGSGNADKEVFYITDASGNLISTYERDVTTSSIIQDYSITGTNLIGMYDPDTEESRYLMYDHLGNVRATFRENTGAIELLSVSDFYPFGMAMPGRNAISTLDKLNLSYQGKELDQTGFHHFGSRQWDARLGRWITTDPANQFYSPYLGMGNTPINGVDPDGELFLLDDLIVGGISFATGYLYSGFNSGDWGWSSIGQGALWAGTAVLALNTGGLSYSPQAALGVGAKLAGSQLASTFLPSFNIPLTNNLSFNVSPSVAFGNNGGFGISYGLTAQAGGFSVTAGAGSSSGGDIAFYGAGYDNGSFGFSLYRTKYWSGSTSQTLGGLGLHLGDVNLNYQNDWPWGDGGDRYRTAALQATYKGFSIGTNLFTGDPGLDGNTRERDGSTRNEKGQEIGGIYRKNKNGDHPDTHREGILYAGYGNYRFGINSEKVRHVIQNKIAHDFLMGGKSGHFRILNTPTTGYFHYGPTNPFSLWR